MALRTTPPPLQGPTAKEKKYDRQLRLWAASGQQALEDAHVVLLNHGAGVVGIETLKNLVLPGVGTFTIIDENIVSEEDLGVNFFLTEKSLGKSRAEECCRYLEELNPEVKGYAIQAQIETLMFEPDLFDQYTLILVASPAQISRTLKKVSDFASQHEIPLFYIHSVGFYSQFSLQLPAQFPIVDTHPDSASIQDLRLLNPWPDLSEFMRMKTRKLETLNDHDHGHIPYLLILLHYLDTWKASHDGKPPENYKEKTSFRDIVRGGARSDNAEGGEENFDEAVAAVLKSLNPPSISSGLREVFDVDECKSPKMDSANFWIIAHAIRNFHASYGVLPLPGSLPDMKAQSADYIQLQNIYKAKARKDLTAVTDQIRSLEKQLGRQPAIEQKEIEAFCKGAAFVKLVQGRPIRLAERRLAEGSNSGDWSDRGKYMIQKLQDDESLMPICLALLAYDYNLEHHRNLPSPINNHPLLEKCFSEDFTRSITQYTSHFLEQLQTTSRDFDIEAAKQRLQPVIAELARSGGAELHNISALTGGMVAQEVIKVITKQYIPINNTCVFDGITSKSEVFRL